MSDRIWAPWRIEYILSEKPDYCVFCKYINEDNDEENMILRRMSKAFIIMNRYPYSNGHLMVLPNRHTSDYGSLDAVERDEMSLLLQQSVAALQSRFYPEGLNIGMNLGKAAGAGIEEHLHYHIVPRWVGDTNYMTVCGDIRVIPEHIRHTYEQLRDYFKNK